MPTRKLNELINQAQLPSAVDVIAKLQQAVAASNSSTQHIANTLKTDVGLSARILRLANSAFYGSQSIETVEQAIVLIGTDDLIALIISTEVIDVFRGLEMHLDMQRFWRINLYGALTAKQLGRRTQLDTSSLFTAGLLRGVGELVLFRALPDLMSELLSGTCADHPRHELEKNTLGFDHAAVGAALLERWKLPESVTIPVRYYLEPAQITGPYHYHAAILNLGHQTALFAHDACATPIIDHYLGELTGVGDDELVAEIKPMIDAQFEDAAGVLLGN
ncbi:MAG: HDOD domain-containing protein [Gammaproteobacteria bacterium]|nr:HDOD domain-containing protein [Gammaproteobacteria bacterium]